LDDLIEEVKTGNSDSADKLVRLFYDEIFYYVFKLTHCKDISLDLTQEIFIRCLKNIKSFKSTKGSFKSWLYKLAHNYVMNYFKSKRYKIRFKQINDNDYLVDGLDLEDSLIKQENNLVIKNALESLHPKYKEIIIMRFYEEYSIKDIALDLNINENTVKTRLRRGLNNLKKCLESGWSDEL